MGKNPKISIIMPVKDGQEFISEAIESILDQSMKDWELLIMDNGSQDGSHDIALEYRRRDERIKVVKNSNTGFTQSLNLLLEMSKGQYVARLDSDDLSLPERLKSQSIFLDKNRHVLMVGARCKIINADDNSTYEHGPHSDRNSLRWSLLFANDFWHSAVMWRNSCKMRYDTRFTYSQDYELWSRMAKKYEIIGQEETLGIVRKRQKSISNQKNKIQKEFATMVSKKNQEYYLGKQIEYETSAQLNEIYRGLSGNETSKIVYGELLEKFGKIEAHSGQNK